jgi:predicted MFS family arabinose efflux permease
VISLGPYVRLLSAPDLRALFAASVIGRLPVGMCGLAILLLVQSTTGSFAMGGAASAAYITGLATMAPPLGRVIDRNGPRTTLIACGAIFPVALCALVAAVTTHAPSPLVLACAALAGATFPPITVCMRTYLRQRLAEEPVLSTAYSLESVLIETVFIVGPMLVAVFMAFASAAAAVWFAAGSAALGVLLFLRAPALGGWRIQARGPSSVFGPLAQTQFSTLMGVVVCYACAFGLTEIGVAAYAAEVERPALAGVLLGLMSVGSATGGLAYGSRARHRPLLIQFASMLAIMGAGLLLLAAPWTPLIFAFFSVLGGVVMAPALIIQSMLVAKIAPPEQTTEAFTWSTSALLTGVGAGAALGGVLVEWRSSAAAFLAAGALALVAALAAWWLARR